ncbi:MAG: DEAD/DEAH box helicase [Candidatus Thorarchaeota archaeon]
MNSELTKKSRTAKVGIMKLENLPINKRVITLLQDKGVSSLFPTQQQAFDTKVLDGKNIVLAVPTSSGKTLVAEICMLKAILDGRGKALYLVPLKSLAHEKYEEFKKYDELGITTAMSVGDFDSSGTQLNSADIVVLTTERADSLVRNKADWIDEVGIIVVDEVHLVNDQSRGPTLEMVLAKLRKILPKIQIIALSATISNANEIAGWLDAELVKSTWRPISLKEGVYLDGNITFDDYSIRNIRRTRKEDITDIICDILEEEGQVLVFVSSRRSTVALGKKIASAIRPFLSNETLKELANIAKRIEGKASAPEATKTLARILRLGAAFHHAGLSNQERKFVEDCFKKNLLKVIVATPTLAAGVNLPARRVIIRDYRRFEKGRGSVPIPILEYKQMAGRAGRPKYDKYGEAVLLARTEQEQEFLNDHYILSEPEEITSKLASEVAIRSHILSAVASEMTCNREEIDNLIEGTFFSYQFDRWEIDEYVSSSLTFLEEGELIKSDESGQIHATLLGQRTSRLYIDPLTAIQFRDALSEADNPSELGILHLICHSSDQPKSYVARSEFEDYEIFLDDNADELMVPVPDSWEDPEGYSSFLAEIKTARMLQDWISEQSEKDITEDFNIGMGDVHRYVQSAEWLLYSASEIVRVCNIRNQMPEISSIKQRIKYGVREELLELVSIKGIGRVRGRMLYSHNLRNLADLYNVPFDDLAGVPIIGTSVAKLVKQQLGIEVDTEEIEQSSSDDEENGPFQTLLEDFDGKAN